MATPEDLDETVNIVEKEARRIVARHGNVRDFKSMQQLVADRVAELGRLDFVLANAGSMPIVGQQATAMTAWHEAIDVMLAGVFNTVEVAMPHAGGTERRRGDRDHQFVGGPEGRRRAAP